MCGGYKKHDGKKPRREGVGKGKKDRGCLAKYRLKLLSYLAKHLGFLPCGKCGGFFSFFFVFLPFFFSIGLFERVEEV
jgi:hypothetical protein